MAVSRAMSRLMLKSAKRAFIADSLSRRDWPTCRALSCHRREFHCQARHVPTQGCARKPPGLPSCGTSKTSPAAIVTFVFMISCGAYLAPAPTPRRASTNSGQFRSVCRDSRAKQRNRQGGYYHEVAGDKLFTFTRMQLDACMRSSSDGSRRRPCCLPRNPFRMVLACAHSSESQQQTWRRYRSGPDRHEAPTPPARPLQRRRRRA
jgi:hypothetical protein